MNLSSRCPAASGLTLYSSFMTIRGHHTDFRRRDQNLYGVPSFRLRLGEARHPPGAVFLQLQFEAGAALDLAASLRADVELVLGAAQRAIPAQGLARVVDALLAQHHLRAAAAARLGGQAQLVLQPQ